MLAIVAGLIAIERYGRRNVTTEFSAESPRLTQRTPLAGIKGGLAFAACLLPVLLGFLVPLLYLAHQSFKRGLFANFDMALWRDAFNSVAFASLATLAALLLGFATILAWRWRPNTAALRRDEHRANWATRCPGWCWRSACWRRCSPSTTR